MPVVAARLVCILAINHFETKFGELSLRDHFFFADSIRRQLVFSLKENQSNRERFLFEGDL